MDEWRSYLDSLSEQDRQTAQTILRYVLMRVGAELRQAGVRSKLNADRVTEAHIRIDNLSDQVDVGAKAIGDIQEALAQMALDLERLKEREAGGDVSRD